ncbi:I78 family peptidase inhibitor [Stenotrophomonas sp. 24(2023)]|uniref:I78 family peptidase inhibitor n=1 Tax=Stenotrophomonas sp. 24(2023) TaxID=3068324 RepID=UPI0027E1FCA5|nr:I78 family peptidase inhibitor [Stenotrophomonas sp. 24(2023)]WMJ71169.1 I78 family peptidase inhibitor [Stenotrophomonas sp. 24(2023)]
MRLHLLLICALPLAACSHAGTPGAAPGTAGSTPVVAAPGAPARCNPDALKGLEGQMASKAVVDKAVKDSGARHARVVKPGMAVTMDFREDRLTLQVDENNRISGASCS